MRRAHEVLAAIVWFLTGVAIGLFATVWIFVNAGVLH